MVSAVTTRMALFFAKLRTNWISPTTVLVVGLASLATACSSPVSVPLGPGPPSVSMSSLGKAPVTGAEASFAFIEVTGMPAEMRFALEDAIEEQAATRKMTLLPEGDPSAVYTVKGYLSAVGDENGVQLVYTWDVHDRAGNRLHRVSGQESGHGGLGDPWNGVDRPMIELVAQQTVDDLSDWSRG
jgi:hypothetical protein